MENEITFSDRCLCGGELKYRFCRDFHTGQCQICGTRWGWTIYNDKLNQMIHRDLEMEKKNPRKLKVFAFSFKTVEAIAAPKICFAVVTHYNLDEARDLLRILFGRDGADICSNELTELVYAGRVPKVLFWDQSYCKL